MSAFDIVCNVLLTITSLVTAAVLAPLLIVVTIEAWGLLLGGGGCG